MHLPSLLRRRRADTDWDRIDAAREAVEQQIADARAARREQQDRAAAEQVTVRQPQRDALARNGFAAVIRTGLAQGHDHGRGDPG